MYEQFVANDIALFAISYDPVEELAKFGERFGITYPLLSDEGSVVIRQLGLLNERVFEQHAAAGVPPNEDHYGVSYPGVFVIDERGVVTGKRFYHSYRERETGSGLLEHALGIVSSARGAEASDEGPAVTVRAWLDSPTYAFNQRLHATVHIKIAPGFHIYGQPVPDGYVPVSVEIEPLDGLVVGEPEWPLPREFRLPGLDERFMVYEEALSLAIPLTFLLRPGSGDHVVRMSALYQACTDTDCLPPASIGLELPVRERALRLE